MLLLLGSGIASSLNVRTAPSLRVQNQTKNFSPPLLLTVLNYFFICMALSSVVFNLILTLLLCLLCSALGYGIDLSFKLLKLMLNVPQH